ncbi:MAG: hypothetical protein AB1643_01305 [Patescibacteria group bacterium]
MNKIVEAFKKAEEAKKRKNDNLLSLDEIVIEKMTTEQIAEKEKQVQERRRYAEIAAQKAIAIQREINVLRQIALHGVLSDDDKKKMTDLEKLKERLLQSGDEELKKHMKFSLFIQEIRSAPKEVGLAKDFLKRCVDCGRYRIADQGEIKENQATKKWPAGTLFFNRIVYIPILVEEEKTPAQRALEAELRKYLNEVRKIEDEKNRNEIGVIRKKGRPDLSLFKAGEHGTYSIYFPERVDESGRKWFEGAGLLSLCPIKMYNEKAITGIKILTGAGSLQWMQEFAGKWIPFSWFTKNQIPETIPGELAELAEKFIKMLRAGLAAYYHSSK